MVEQQSEIGRDAQFAMLLRHKWQAEIERLKEAPREGDKGLTSPELARKLGKSESTMTRILRDGIMAGRYVKGRAYRQNSDGVWYLAPVYRIKKHD